MVTLDEIDAFKEDFDTVQQFVDRAMSGKPEDRWTTGAKGNAALAASCRRVLSFVNLQAAIMEDMHNQIQSIGEASMEPHSDPCRG